MGNLYNRKYSEIIKELRNEKGESQAQFAKKIDVSQSAVAKWELEKSEPTASALIKMSIHFNKTTDFILGLEDDWGNKITINEEKKPKFMKNVTPIIIKPQGVPEEELIPAVARSKDNAVKAVYLTKEEIEKIQASRIPDSDDDELL